MGTFVISRAGCGERREARWRAILADQAGGGEEQVFRETSLRPWAPRTERQGAGGGQEERVARDL